MQYAEIAPECCSFTFVYGNASAITEPLVFVHYHGGPDRLSARGFTLPILSRCFVRHDHAVRVLQSDWRALYAAQGQRL